MAEPRETPAWTWDIEATEWDQARCVVVKSTAGDVERFAGPDCLRRISDVMDKAGGQWIAHAGGIYDTLLLSNVREPWDELIMSGAAVLCARKGRLRVRDSFRWWLAGLGKVGQYLERLESEKPHREHPPGYWLKKDVDRSRIAELSDADVLDYCESDTTILLGGVVAARDYMAGNGAKPAWTAGASALSLLETLEPASWRLLDRHALTLADAIAAGDVVRGARVENWARGTVDGVWCYDFKSAYPAAYAFRELPVGARRAPADTDHPGAVVRVRWFWPHRDRIPPVLDDVTGAGAGWCSAWCVPDELDLLRTEGAQHIERLEAWAPALMAPIGQVFARRLYMEKERGSFFGKVFLNSLHGKFSESPIKDFWRLKRPDKHYGPPPTLTAGSASRTRRTTPPGWSWRSGRRRKACAASRRSHGRTVRSSAACLPMAWPCSPPMMRSRHCGVSWPVRERFARLRWKAAQGRRMSAPGPSGRWIAGTSVPTHRRVGRSSACAWLAVTT